MCLRAFFFCQREGAATHKLFRVRHLLFLIIEGQGRNPCFERAPVPKQFSPKKLHCSAIKRHSKKDERFTLLFAPFDRKSIQKVRSYHPFFCEVWKQSDAIFWGEIAPALEPFQTKDSSLVLLSLGTVHSELKILQNCYKNYFYGKRTQYTTCKVIQRLFNIDLYTYLSVYRYR